MNPQTPQPSPGSTGPTGGAPQAPPPPQSWPPQSPTPAPPTGAPAGTTTSTSLPASTICQAVALVLTITALILTSDGQDSWYESTTAWAIFATLAAIVQLAPALAKTTGWSAEKSWTIGAVGVAGLFAWWVLIALPGVSSNQGFAATMAVAAAVVGSWLSPARRL